LLTSVDPLQVYIFKDAYLRICGQTYDIEKFNDPIRHLSNYSIQKNENNFPDDEKEFVMSTSEFISRLGQENVTWEKTFYS
jgi:tubulin monoglycylase TTLL3/8